MFLGLALSAAACSHYGPPPDIVPPPAPVTGIEQLSGDYCYFGPEFNIRSYALSPKAIPFVNVGALGVPTKVSVSASASEIVFTYVAAGGGEARDVFVPERVEGVWREGALEVKWGAPLFHVLGYGWEVGSESGVSRLFKLADGKLVMTGSFQTKGYAEEQGYGGHPFHFYKHERAVAVLLDPATGDCAIEAASRQRQPWFGYGLDIRDPACAAELQEQLTAYLIKKGEAEADATPLAIETVEQLRRSWIELGAGSFVVRSQKATYGFEIEGGGSECKLKLVWRQKGSFSESGPFFRRLPLPGCICNP